VSATWNLSRFVVHRVELQLRVLLIRGKHQTTWVSVSTTMKSVVRQSVVPLLLSGTPRIASQSLTW
jgi:hypothetical protein